jgi:integrase
LPDIRFHDLRHSVATLLLSIGTHPKVVQELLGHGSIGITMDTYSHGMPTMQKNVMARLDDMFGGMSQKVSDGNEHVADSLEGI